MTIKLPASFLRPVRARTAAVAAGLVGLITALDVGSVRVSTQTGRGGIVQALTADDVNSVIAAAATSISDSGMAVAVVDRAGRILGVWARAGAAAGTPDIAV